MLGEAPPGIAPPPPAAAEHGHSTEEAKQLWESLFGVGPGSPQEAAAAPEAADADAPETAGETHPYEQRSHWPARCWRQLDEVDLAAEFRLRVRTVRDPPRWFRSHLGRAYRLALTEWQRCRSAGSWKLFLLIPRLLLRPSGKVGKAGKAAFLDRARRFEAGEWTSLLHESRGEAPTPSTQPAAAERPATARADALVRLGEVSRARLALTSRGLAPGTQATLAELRDTTLRPRELSAPLPAEVFGFDPAAPLQLERATLVAALRSAGRGSAADLGGLRYEHLRVLLDDPAAWGIFCDFAAAFARAEVPAEIGPALGLGRLTAMRKANGRGRGIVTGSVLRRLIARAIAHQYGKAITLATLP